MPTTTAWSIGRHWASCRRHRPPAVLLEDVADQAQQHLAHGATPDYLRAVAYFMAVEHPGWYDLSLAMSMRGAPQPEPSAAPGRRRCPCRGVLAPV
ncbi:hypothetical protein ACN6K5_000922 [Streptomyces violaceoruber]|uniref:hypothetical protein n=1 Tax=Streptomyces violaceoruber TaxID=1935 RepID=UPI00403D1052